MQHGAGRLGFVTDLHDRGSVQRRRRDMRHARLRGQPVSVRQRRRPAGVQSRRKRIHNRERLRQPSTLQCDDASVHQGPMHGRGVSVQRSDPRGLQRHADRVERGADVRDSILVRCRRKDMRYPCVRRGNLSVRGRHVERMQRGADWLRADGHVLFRGALRRQGRPVRRLYSRELVVFRSRVASVRCRRAERPTVADVRKLRTVRCPRPGLRRMHRRTVPMHCHGAADMQRVAKRLDECHRLRGRGHLQCGFQSMRPDGRSPRGARTGVSAPKTRAAAPPPAVLVVGREPSAAAREGESPRGLPTARCPTVPQVASSAYCGGFALNRSRSQATISRFSPSVSLSLKEGM